MMRKGWIAVLALCLLLSGCAAKKAVPEGTGTIMKLYYEQAEPSFAQTEGVLFPEEYTFPTSEVDAKTLLSVYWSGPYSPESVSAIPKDAKILDVSAEQSEVQMVVSDEFFRMEGMQKMRAIAELTYTVTQLEGIESIALFSQFPSGRLLEGRYGREDFLVHDDSTENPSFTENLYFTDHRGTLTDTQEVIFCADQSGLPEAVMKALLAGPDRPLRTNIPAQTELLDVAVSQDLATVLLSEAFSQCDTSEQEARSAVMQIVQTLCALDGIRAVQIRIVGDLGMEHFDISRPLSPP